MKQIIVELIPTSLNKGEIIQLSALKLDELQLIDRFDYRIVDSKVPFESLLDLINYDQDSFIYKKTTKEILTAFKEWCQDYKILFIDNAYSLNYLSYLDNEKESVFNYLNMKYSDNIIDEIIEKYNLEPSNYIVDLLYEALIYESNSK